VADPLIVHHYTSTDTLLKIVTAEKGKECVWATNIRFLNDTKERDHCREMIAHRLAQLDRNRWLESGYDFAAALSKIDESDWHTPYVASFSTDPDSLPQWRAYCPNGNGVSIGFRVASLKNASLTRELIQGKIQPTKATLAAVQYLGSSNFDKVDSLLDNCVSEIECWRKEQNALPPEERTKADDDALLTSILSRTCAHVKHASFGSEKEYRLTAPIDVFGAEGPLHFRSSRTTVIPYKKLFMPEWGNSTYGSGSKNSIFNDYFIDQIMVGPTPNPDLTVEALRKLFLSKRLCPLIRKTEAPYRDL
jgi:hypothetical protein